MNNSRYVVLGLARPRATWFVEVSRWANAGSAPLDFVKCVSAEEVRARLSTGRAFSAVLIDANHPGLDRDLVDVAREAGATTILVGSRGSRDAAHLGAANVLAENFSRSDLLAALTEGSTSIEETSPAAALLEDLVVTPPTTNAWHGQLIAVTGPGGSGRSTIAMGLADSRG